MSTPLPADYAALVAAGVRSLRWMEAGLRARAAAPAADPALWLRVRDAGGFADRLEVDDWTWRTGFASLDITGQDLGALDEFVADCEEPSPYRDDPAAEARAAHAAPLRALAAFLRHYTAEDFAPEDPAPLPHPGDGRQGADPRDRDPDRPTGRRGLHRVGAVAVRLARGDGAE